MKANLFQAAVDTAAGFAANKIGDWGADGTLNFPMKFVAYTGIGALMGAALNKDRGKGAIAGAIGGAADMFAEMIESQYVDQLKQMSAEQRQKTRRVIADVARLGSGIISLAAGQDVKMTMAAASNALDNNFIIHNKIYRQWMGQPNAQDIIDDEADRIQKEAESTAHNERLAKERAQSPYYKMRAAKCRAELEKPIIWWHLPNTSPSYISPCTFETPQEAIKAASAFTFVIPIVVDIYDTYQGNISRAQGATSIGIAVLPISMFAKPFASVIRPAVNIMQKTKQFFRISTPKITLLQTMEALNLENYAVRSAYAKNIFKSKIAAKNVTTKETTEGFKGQKGHELKNTRYQPLRNQGTTISNRQFSGHALDQMQNRGITPSIVENTIKNGLVYSTNPGTKGFYDNINNIRVILNSENGKIITVIIGKP